MDAERIIVMLEMLNCLSPTVLVVLLVKIKKLLQDAHRFVGRKQKFREKSNKVFKDENAS